MNEQKEKIRKRLEEFLPKLIKRTEIYRKRGMSEADTKAKIIEPLLERLGWDLRGEEVVRAHTIRADWQPVHYLLKIGDEPRLLIETKKLGASLNVKDAARIVEYGDAAGISWCVLTNGKDVRVYNSKWSEAPEKRLFLQVSLTRLKANMEDEFDGFFETIWLLSRESVKSRELESEGNREYAKRVISKIWTEEKTVRFLCERAKLKKVNESVAKQSVKELDVRDLFPFPARPPWTAAIEGELTDKGKEALPTAKIAPSSEKAVSVSEKGTTSLTVEGVANQVHEEAVRKAFTTAVGRLNRLGRDVKEEPRQRSVVYKVKDTVFAKIKPHRDYFEIDILNPSTGRWLSFDMNGGNLNRLKDRTDKIKDVYKTVRKG